MNFADTDNDTLTELIQRLTDNHPDDTWDSSIWEVRKQTDDEYEIVCTGTVDHWSAFSLWDIPSHTVAIGVVGSFNDRFGGAVIDRFGHERFDTRHAVPDGPYLWALRRRFRFPSQATPSRPAAQQLPISAAENLVLIAQQTINDSRSAEQIIHLTQATTVDEYLAVTASRTGLCCQQWDDARNAAIDTHLDDGDPDSQLLRVLSFCDGPLWGALLTESTHTVDEIYHTLDQLDHTVRSALKPTVDALLRQPPATGIPASASIA